MKEAKPSLRLYQNLLEKLKEIKPEECLFVGNDMLNDVMPAQRVGMRTALFAGDRRSLRLRSGDSRVQGVEPDLVLTHLNQLMECLVCLN
ncbi:MAG: HAD family hydrolase [Kiritimatiellia bacterium]